MEKLGIIAEYVEFLRQQKKWWMVPIVIMLLLLGALIMFAAGSPLAPLIYTLF